MIVECNYIAEASTPKCNVGGIKSILLIDAKDIVYNNGEMRMKRKYGKFKREVKSYLLPVKQKK